MAHELFNNIVITGNKMRIANAVAREKYLLFSTLSRAAVEAQMEVLNIRAELARVYRCCGEQDYCGW